MRPYSHHKQSSWFDRANEDDGQFSRALLGSGFGGLAGAGLGGLGGLIKETFFTKPERAQYLRRALQGALIGGLGGAGIGAGVGASNWALDRHDDLRDRIDDHLTELRREMRLGMAREFNAINSAITGLPFGMTAPQIDIAKVQKGLPEDWRARPRPDFDTPRPEFRDKASNYKLLKYALAHKLSTDSELTKAEQAAFDRMQAQTDSMMRAGLSSARFVGASGTNPGYAVKEDGRTAINPADQANVDKFLAEQAAARAAAGIVPAAPTARPPAPAPAPAPAARPPAPAPAARPVAPAATPRPTAPTPATRPPAPAKPRGVPSGSGGGGIDE